MDAASPNDEAHAEGSPRPRWSRRLGLRLIAMPLLILVAAWLLRTHAGREEAARVAVIEADVRRYVGDVLEDRSLAPAIDEVVPGLHSVVAERMRESMGGVDPDGVEVTVEAGGRGLGPLSAATHVATLAASGTPRLRLQVGHTGERTVLAGWSRPAGPDATDTDARDADTPGATSPTPPPPPPSSPPPPPPSSPPAPTAGPALVPVPSDDG